MPEEPRIHNWNVNMGVNQSTISGWVKQLSPIKVSEEETVTLKEYKALQKEIQRLKTKNEILKKATAIFAKEQSPRLLHLSRTT